MLNLLPIGSVVNLIDENKKLMIFGRKIEMKENGTIKDYLGCLYPEGHINQDYIFAFDHTDIKEVVFTGFSNEEDVLFLEKLEELLSDENI